MLSRWNSLRLGILSHYICDFMCYVHTPAFKGSLKEHRAYEEEQSRYLDTQCARAVCSFYQAGSGEELTALLGRVLRERDPASYSPEDDLEYAAAVATELTCAILRIRTARPGGRQLVESPPLYAAAVSVPHLRGRRIGTEKERKDDERAGAESGNPEQPVGGHLQRHPQGGGAFPPRGADRHRHGDGDAYTGRHRGTTASVR